MAASGTLQARAFASNAQLPLRGVAIRITERTPEGSMKLLALRITDESGMIGPIVIEAPERAGSQAPGTGQPFTQVDLSAECPGYEQILVEGIQIFAGVRTIQELAMIPYPQYPEYYNLTEVFPISPQAL